MPGGRGALCGHRRAHRGPSVGARRLPKVLLAAFLGTHGGPLHGLASFSEGLQGSSLGLLLLCIFSSFGLHKLGGLGFVLLEFLKDILAASLGVNGAELVRNLRADLVVDLLGDIGMTWSKDLSPDLQGALAKLGEGCYSG